MASEQQVLEGEMTGCGDYIPKKKETLSNTKSQNPTLPCPRDSAAGSKPPDGDNPEVEGKKVQSLSPSHIPLCPRHGGSEADCPSALPC